MIFRIRVSGFVIGPTRDISEDFIITSGIDLSCAFSHFWLGAGQ